MRADLKWHKYQPEPTVKKIKEFADLVDRDEYHFFMGRIIHDLNTVE